MSSLVYLLLLFISFHACNARYLWDTDYKGTPKGFPYFHKDMKKEKPIGHNDQIEICGSSGGANSIKHVEMRVPLIIKEDTIDFKITASSSPAVLQEATKIEERKRRARLMLGSSRDAEETVDSKENEAAEDIVAMDYAQPHKKAPIHNR